MQPQSGGNDVPGHRPSRIVHAITGRPLTRREREIVRLVLHGETNRGIAASLGISEQTVKGQLGRLYAKVGVKSRLELAMKVLKR
jgi:DNA-binding NarL/FixJ family response regulator